MFARTVVLQARSDRGQEANAIFRDSVLPAARQQHGFMGGYLLSNLDTGKAMSITLWESEADLIAGERSGYFLQQVEKFAPLLAGPPVREIYKVVAEA
jgi:heme-degrading monooxygenase HmoA